MADTTELKRKIVKKGRAEFEAIELALETAIAGANNLVPIFNEAVQAGMVDGRKGINIMNRLRKVVGLLGDASEEIHDLHAEGTKVAKKNGVDDELPDGYVVVLGGGGR